LALKQAWEQKELVKPNLVHFGHKKEPWFRQPFEQQNDPFFDADDGGDADADDDDDGDADADDDDDGDAVADDDKDDKVFFI
jgi:hypothetical protein